MKGLDKNEWRKKASMLLKGFMRGLDHIHSNKFLHNDLKVGLCFICNNPVMDISSQINHNINHSIMCANNGTDPRQ